MDKKRIIFATGNAGKMKEVKMILADLNMPVLSMKEAGVEIDVEENGTTFEENAVIKARAIQKMLPGDIVLADDSGLEIDYLNKEPGIYSARYMGEDTSYDIKNAKILERMKNVEDAKRTARFVCVIAAAMPGGEVLTTYAAMEGKIAYQIAGENGFGYDPIFWLDECGCTSAQITPQQKNELSHRGKALRAMKAKIRDAILMPF